MLLRRVKEDMSNGVVAVTTFDMSSGQHILRHRGYKLADTFLTLAEWDAMFPTSWGWVGDAAVDNNTRQASTEVLLNLALRAGWSPEQQAVWLTDHNYEMWDGVDEDVKLNVCGKLQWLLEAFGINTGDKISKLLVTVFR